MSRPGRGRTLGERRTIRDMHKFLRGFDPTLVHVPAQRGPVVHVLWGWWVWLTEQSLLVVKASDKVVGCSDDACRRSVGEHADLMLWLADAGVDGVKPLHISKQHHQQQLWDSYRASEGRPLAIWSGSPISTHHRQAVSKPRSTRWRGSSSARRRSTASPTTSFAHSPTSSTADSRLPVSMPRWTTREPDDWYTSRIQPRCIGGLGRLRDPVLSGGAHLRGRSPTMRSRPESTAGANDSACRLNFHFAESRPPSRTRGRWCMPRRPNRLRPCR